MRFVSVPEVIELQAQLLARTGGTPGILNLSAIDAALYRAQWGPFFGPPDLALRAGLILRGLCQDHPFFDGNKRIAFATTEEFLGRNGFRLEATTDEVVRFMLEVAQDRHDLDAICQWIADHSRKSQVEG